jgi:hypothetical protein
MKVGDLVYIHDSFGPLPKDLFGVITRIKYNTDPKYPPVEVELLTFKEKEKICSWYQPKHLMVLEEAYDAIPAGGQS